MEKQRSINIINLFHIHSHEYPLVRLLFLHYFFQGIGLALFFTAANAIFLSHFPIRMLPWVYVSSAAILLVTGRIYAYCEHRMKIQRLSALMLVALFLSPLLFIAGLSLWNTIWIAFLLMAWFRFMYLLSSLEFWGLSAIIFDVRQSKRLFGLISAGDIPAKLLGYLSVSLLVPFIGMYGLLGLSSLAFFASFLFLRNLSKSKGVQLLHEDLEHQPDANTSFLRKFFGSNLVITISILAFAATLALTLIDFSFLNEVQTQFKSEEELAFFLGLFFSFGKGITLITKLFLTGIIANKLGIKRSLLILPVALLLSALLVISFAFFNNTAIALLWLFGIMMLFDEILTYAIHDPVFLSLFQPLRKHLRLKGHTITKGFIDPLALGLGGLVLIAFLEITGSVNLLNITFILVGILALWIFAVLLVDKQYFRTLKKAIKNRLIWGNELDLNDERVIKILLSKLESNNPAEVISTLHLLNKSRYHKFAQILPRLLHHSSEEVLKETLKFVEQLNAKEALPEVEKLMKNGNSLPLKGLAIRTLCSIKDDTLDEFYQYLEDEDDTVLQNTITGMLKSGGIEAVVLAGQKLLEFTHSHQAERQRMAAEIIGEVKLSNFYRPLLKLLRSTHKEVQLASIESSGKIRNKHLLPELLENIKNNHLLESSMRAVIAFGNEAVPEIENELQTRDAHYKRRLLHILGRNSALQSAQILLAHIDDFSIKCQTQALQSLLNLNYKADQHTREIVLETFQQQLHKVAWLHVARSTLRLMPDNQTLISALSNEINDGIERLFNLLILLFDTQSIIRIRESCRSGDKEVHANALETMDFLLPKSLARDFIPLFEQAAEKEVTEQLRKHFHIGIINKRDIFCSILDEIKFRFGSWTQAVVLFKLKEGNTKGMKERIHKFTRSNDFLLKQTAKYVEAYMQDEDFVNLKADGLEIQSVNNQVMENTENTKGTLLEIEKVLILKTVDIFTDTPDNILADVAGILAEEHLDKGHTIFKKGEIGTCLYLIHNGKVRIHDGKYTLATLGEHQIFGELSLLDPEPRSASVTTIEKSFLLRLDQEAFFEIMSDRIEVARGILKTLTRRLRKQNNIITELKAAVNTEINAVD